MYKPNLQLIYVSDIERSTSFYKKILKSDPVFVSPRYVAFSAGGKGLFALWTGGEVPDPLVTRFCEVGIMLDDDEKVDALYEEWSHFSELNVLQKPKTEIFGRTFLIQDPDGHTIRVCRFD